MARRPGEARSAARGVSTGVTSRGAPGRAVEGGQPIRVGFRFPAVWLGFRRSRAAPPLPPLKQMITKRATTVNPRRPIPLASRDLGAKVSGRPGSRAPKFCDVAMPEYQSFLASQFRSAKVSCCLHPRRQSFLTPRRPGAKVSCATVAPGSARPLRFRPPRHLPHPAKARRKPGEDLGKARRSPGSRPAHPGEDPERPRGTRRRRAPAPERRRLLGGRTRLPPGPSAP